MTYAVRYIAMMGLALVLSAGVSTAFAEEEEPQGKRQHDVKGQHDVQGQHDPMIQKGQEAKQQKYQQRQEQPFSLKQQDVRQARYGDTLLPKETISNLQQILKDRGFYEGRVDGIAGPQTKSALRQFQQQSNIDATAQLNDETVRQLGLTMPGSETAPVRGVDPEKHRQGMHEQQQPIPEQERQSIVPQPSEEDLAEEFEEIY